MTRLSLRLAALSTLLLGFGLRVFQLDTQELRGDEAFGYFFSLRPWRGIVQATLELREPHPTASYFVEKGWLLAAGHSEFALRYASVWFGVLAVALIYRLGCSLKLARTVALLGMLLLALSPYAIWHAQDARMYSMSLALTLASSWLAVAWLDAARGRRLLLALAYISVSWLALHTHYFAAFVLLAHYLFVLGVGIWQRAWRGIVLPWLIIDAALALLYLPWLWLAVETLTGYGGNGDSPDLAAATRRALLVFTAGDSLSHNRQQALLLIAVLLLGIGTVRLLRGRRGAAAAFLWLYLLMPLGATWLSAQQRPIFDERYLVAALPPFLLLMASVLQRDVELEQRRAPALRFTTLTLLGIFLLVNGLALGRYYTDPAASKTRGWRELAAALEGMSAGMAPADVRIAQNFPDPTLWYYYAGPVAHVVLPPAPHDAAGAVQTVTTLRDEGVQRVLLPVQPAPNWDSDGLAQAALAEEYAPLLERQVAGWPVLVFSAPVAEMTGAEVMWANALELAGYDIQPDTPMPASVLAVRLLWDEQAMTLSGSEKVFVQLLGSDGTVVAQQDRPLADAGGSGVPRLYGLDLPAELPSGEYRLITGLYDPAQRGAPRIPLTNGLDHLVLEEWRLEQ